MSDSIDMVYLLGFSEKTSKHLENMLPIIKSQKKKGSKPGMILLLDGVINALAKGRIPDAVEELLSLDLVMYVMLPDLTARGISVDNIQEKIKPIDYLEMVNILDNTPKIISWM